MLVCVGVMSVAGQAGVIRHDRSDSLYLDLAAQSQFDPAGMVRNGTSFCSGVLVAPDWVISAGHCANGGVLPTDLTFDIAGQNIPVAAIYLLGEFNGEPDSGADLSLLKLTTPITGVTPIKLFRGASILGMTGTMVGFGDTGDGLTGSVEGTSGTKRAGQNIFEESGSFLGFDDRIILCDFDEPGVPASSFFGTTIPLELEYQAATLDSGAGLFIEDNGEWFLGGTVVGILTFDPIPNVYGSLTAATRIVPHLAWLDGIMCPQDIDGDHSVNVIDLLRVLTAWGACSVPCEADINRDGMVNTVDLLNLLTNWGSCP